MLNMNVYEQPEGEYRFKYGALLELGNINYNRYNNGEVRVGAFIGSLTSSGTGHWPFRIFDFGLLTGARFAWHVTLFGCCIGRCTINDVDEQGQLVGPDKAKYYFFFSGLNHQRQSLEEII